MTSKEYLFNLKPRGGQEIVHACLLLLALATAPAACTVHGFCRYSLGSSATLLRTSGCQSDTPQQSGFVLSVPLNIGSFSLDHVDGLFQQFKDAITRLKARIHDAHQERIIFGYPEIPRRTYDLNPIRSNTTTLTNTHATSRHRILRELRWWMTAVESALQLIGSTGQLGPQNGISLACEASQTSSMLSSLLRIFSVNTQSLPFQAECREMRPMPSVNTTVVAAATSVLLRDAVSAMSRIEDVLTHCDVRNSTHGLHLVRLRCLQHFSLFYDQSQLAVSEYLYHFNYIVEFVRGDE